MALPCGMQAQREHQPRLGREGEEKLDGGAVAMAGQTGETHGMGGETCLTPGSSMHGLTAQVETDWLFVAHRCTPLYH